MITDEYLIKIQLQVQNDRALRQLNKTLKDTAKEAPAAAQKISKGMKNAGRDTKAFGRIAQNSGYQIQDFVVQVQGGVDPMRALSQQLPQMLVGMGALGAAIGVVAALLPTLIQLFKDTEEEAVDLDEALSSLNGAISQMGKLSDKFNLDPWALEFNKVGAAAQASMMQVLEFERTVVSGELGKAAKGLGAGALPTQDGPQKLGAAAEAQQASLVRRTKEYAESVGVTVDQLKEYNEALLAVQNSQGKDEEAVEKAIVLLREATIARGEQTEENNKYLTTLTAMQSGQVSMAAADELITQAAKGYGVVLAEVTAEGERLNAVNIKSAETFTKTSAAIEQATVSASAAAKIAANDYEQMQILYRQDTAALQEKYAALEEAPEHYSVAAEGIKLFQSSFDTMLNGVLAGTQTLKEGFKDMAKVILTQLAKLAAYQAIFSAFGGSGGTIANQIGNAFDPSKNAKGNAFNNGNVVPFAKGGIVSSPTVFPFAKGVGLMGEAGPEAIMPLSRGADGKLGVSGGGVNVTINNMAPGVDVNQRSDGNGGLTIDIVMKSLTQAISQGGNDITSAMEQTYSLGRGRSVY